MEGFPLMENPIGSWAGSPITRLSLRRAPSEEWNESRSPEDLVRVNPLWKPWFFRVILINHCFPVLCLRVWEKGDAIKMGEAVGAATIDLEWVQAEVDSWEVVAVVECWLWTTMSCYNLLWICCVQESQWWFMMVDIPYSNDLKWYMSHKQCITVYHGDNGQRYFRGNVVAK